MKRHHVVAAAAAGAVLLVIASRPARAQDWRPPTTAMPVMPAAAEVDESWAGGQSRWFIGGGGVKARAEGGGRQARFVRFTGGDMRAVAAWSDRNGDGRCDMVEVYRDGALAAQVIDPDYDGTANVLRVYSDGKLVREERL
jgi:hypothetical protein